MDFIKLEIKFLQILWENVVNFILNHNKIEDYT